MLNKVIDDESPLEMCKKYSLGQLDREQLVLLLGSFPYSSDCQVGDEIEIRVDPGSRWIEVAQAADQGLIDDRLYSEIFNARYGAMFEQRWPELFAPLKPEQRLMIIHPLASQLHNQHRVHRQAAADLIAFALKQITFNEYQERQHEQC